MAEAQIIKSQAPESIPTSENVGEATNLLVPPPRAADILSQFPPEVYTTDAESHLARFMKVLLGDAGIGGIRKSLLLARMQTTLQGSHFFDLDRFYGALFGARRRPDEIINIDPHSDLATNTEWDEIQNQDASYRSRVEQFARAIGYCPSPTGMELVAEALLNVDCDVYESFPVIDSIVTVINTYGSTEALTFDQMEARTWAQLEGSTNPDAVVDLMDRWSFTVVPKREITEDERYDVLRALNHLKPAQAFSKVDPSGFALHEAISASGFAADSEYWEVRANLTPPANIPVEDLPYSIEWGVVALPGSSRRYRYKRPPWSRYQGEVWSYISQVLGVVAYSEDESGNFEADYPFNRVFFDETNWRDYQPFEGLVLLSRLNAGRGISDGIFARHPYYGPRRVIGAPPAIAMPQMVSGGVLVGSTQTGVGDQGDQTVLRFWPTAVRTHDDGRHDHVEIKFRNPVSINFVSFEVSRFPHHLTVERRRASGHGWETVLERTITDCVPLFVSRGSRNRDPLHYGADHWLKIEESITPALTTSLRVKVKRISGNGPYDGSISAMEAKMRSLGQLYFDPNSISYHWGRTRIPYSLAVRNFNAGFRVTSPGDWPKDPPPPTTDEYGSMVEFELYQEKANRLLDGMQWRSEPQPIPDAIVNFYADMRDAQGEPQVIDRFEVDPTHPGPHISLYYSNDVPSTRFEASDQELPFGVVNTFGSVIADPNGIIFAADDHSLLDVSNTGIQFDPSLDWVLAAHLSPGFASNTVTERPLLSFGDNKLTVLNDNLVFTAEGGDVVTLSAPFGVGAEVKIVLAYVASNDNTEFEPGTLMLWAQVDTNPVHIATDDVTTPIVTKPSFVRLSGLSTTDPLDAGIGGYMLRSLVLKTGDAPTDTQARQIIAALPDYSFKPDSADDDHGTDNAILRFHPRHYSESNLFGMRGGPGDFWAAVSWTPIARDYTLQKGFLYVPPTRARLWKFEFTNLVAEPYESFLPITRTVKVYPKSVTATVLPTWQQPTKLHKKYGPGLWTNITIPTNYRDQLALAKQLISNPQRIPTATTSKIFLGPLIPRGSFVGSTSTVNIQEAIETTDVDPSGRTVASSLYVKSLTVRSQTAQQGLWWLTGAQPWHQGTIAPIHVTVGRHTYHEETVTHTTKTAFFVGLKSVIPHRLRFAAEDDAPVYSEHFDDDKHLADGSTWTLTPGDMSSPSSNALAVSTPYLSDHNIVALHFATQQSDPVQIVPDDNFRDPILLDNDWTDEDGWHQIGDAKIEYSVADFSVLVSRNIDEGAVQQYQPGLLQPPDHTPFSSGAGSQAVLDRTVGGLASGLNNVSPMGRLYAAVRVTPLTDLEAPLVLEIRGTDGSLLASKSFTPPKGEISEVYLDYTLGSYDPGYRPTGTYMPRSLITKPWKLPFSDVPLTPLVDPPPLTDIDNTASVRIVQYGATADEWKVDALSIFDDSIVWEFSNDGGTTWVPAYNVRNNANGILTFPTPGNALLWRVHGFREDLHISAVQVRPVYEHRLNLRTAGPHRGPNVSTFDHEPPIDADPQFTVWTKPVPRWWFLEGKRFPTIPPTGRPPTTEESRFLGRSADETIPTPVDSATGVLVP